MAVLVGPARKLASGFVRFGGAAYDVDHDVIAESQRISVPEQIVALKRRGGR